MIKTYSCEVSVDSVSFLLSCNQRNTFQTEKVEKNKQLTVLSLLAQFSAEHLQDTPQLLPFFLQPHVLVEQFFLQVQPPSDVLFIGLISSISAVIRFHINLCVNTEHLESYLLLIA